MNDEIRALKTFFNSKQIYLPDVWLQSCITWCKTETLPPNYTEKDLQLKVYAQFLLLDLRDVEMPVIPPDLNVQKLTTLQGNYCLQMMKVVDISKPKYWQLQRIRRNLVKNVDAAKDFGNRVLLLTLTDGVRDIDVMEFKPIRCLNINLPPGTKVRISGPAKVRRGQIMLEEKNISVLGGEVEELLIVNHPENVLARELGLEENPSPTRIEEKILEVNNEEEENVNVQRTQNNALINRNNANLPSVVTTNKKNLPDHPFENELDFDDEEARRIDSEIDNLMELEREFQGESSKKTTGQVINGSPDIFDDIELNDDDFANIDQIVEETEKKNEEARQISPQKPKMTLDKILRNQRNISNGKFTVKVKFKEVVEKLSLHDGVFKLVIKVSDETSEAVVKVHSDVVSDFTGYCPSALLVFKEKIAEKDQDAMQKVISAMQELKNRLTNLDDTVELQILKNEQYPILVNIIQN